MLDALQIPNWFSDSRLAIRRPTAADGPRITEICQDVDIQRFTRIPVPYGPADASSFVSLSDEQIAVGSGAHLLVEVDGSVAGCVGASLDPIDRLAVLGYWTAPEARRRGTTTRAMHRLCRWLLDEVRLDRLELYAAATNTASNRVAARLGFTLEGTRRSAMLLRAVGDHPARRVDANDWGLLPGELR